MDDNQAPPKPKKPRKVSVRSVGRTDGDKRVVEWATQDGALARSLVALSAIDREGNTVSEKVLKANEIGEDWSAIELAVSPERLQTELRNRGIWTKQDALANMNTVRAAFNAALKDDFEAFANHVRST